MALFRYPNSKVWWFDFRFDRKRVRMSTKTRSKTLALDAERAKRRELEEGHAGIKKRSAAKPFSQAAADYLATTKGRAEATDKTDVESLRVLNPWFGKMLLSDIGDMTIHEFQQVQLVRGRAATSINRHVACLRAIMRKNGFWDPIKSGVRMLPINEEAGHALTPDEERRLLAACAKSRSLSFYPAVVLALSTGMRYGELRHTTWEAIDFKAKFLIVRRSKTRHGRNRRIPLNKRALTALKSWSEQWPDRQPSDFVFPTERYGASGHKFLEWKPKRYAVNVKKPILSWNTAWRNAKKEAGVRVRFHDLRHTVVTRLLLKKVPFTVVSAMMGWSAANAMLMIKKYGHLQPGFREAVAHLNGPRQKVPE
jgi:integrase